MNCSICGFATPSGSKFCGNCAQPLKLVYSKCRFENPPGFKFCGECAAPLISEAKTKPRSPNPDPRSYTPKHLAEKILPRARWKANGRR